MAEFAVIFDMDGVLTDTAALHAQSWVQLAEQLGRRFTIEDYAPLRGRAREDSLRLFLGYDFDGYSAAQRAEMLRSKQALFLELLARLSPADCLPGVARLLAELRGEGVACAVASSSRNTGAVLAQVRIADMFDVVVDANEPLAGKPDPALFFAAAARLKMNPNDCVVVEDSEAGVMAARAAGMHCLGVGPADRVGGADKVVPSLAKVTVADLRALLRG